jgi:uncharacterized cupredoxin-like copper-binding protein
VLVLGLGAALVLPACGGAGSSGEAHLGIVERDFRIQAERTAVRPGRVELEIENHGPVDHELIVVREDGRPLPLRASGLSVDEEGLQRRIAGTIEARGPGVHTDLAVDLAPGRYVLICNMAGHYQSGMHAELVVG